jgi:hypothetical protein
MGTQVERTVNDLHEESTAAVHKVLREAEICFCLLQLPSSCRVSKERAGYCSSYASPVFFIKWPGRLDHLYSG